MKNSRADGLIERYIELDPNRPNKANARLKDSKLLYGRNPATSGTEARVGSCTFTALALEALLPP